MRFSSLLGPAAAGWPTLLSILPTIHALSFDSVSTPKLDLASLGRVTITGDFDGVSLYQYHGQSEQAHKNGTHSILTPLPNGILTNLSSSDAQIKTMCPFTEKDGNFAGIFVGGNFTSLGGVKSPGAALFNPTSGKVTALPGLSGSVSTVLCDQDSNRVYVGGSFTHDNSSNVIAWSPDDGWTDLPFDSVNGPVNSILKTSNGHIVFGGSFDGQSNSTSSSKDKDSKDKDSSKSKDKQILNLQNAKIKSDADTPMSGYSDPKNIVCSTSGKAGKDQTYLLHDYAPGFWQAYLGFEFHPVKVRLYNTHMDGRGTKNFLLRALPDNGIMNLTYTDESGKKSNCDSSCPLSDDPDEKYRDFTLVNPVGMGGFQIEFLDWYGQGAGLNGVEVFQDEIFTYAVQDYNEPTCAGIQYPSKSTRTGPWTTESGYLSAKVSDTDASKTSLVFEPDIKESGNYTIRVFTPGCSQDGSCASRGTVNVTATVANSDEDSKQPSPALIAQTNDHDKYDTLFTGYVDASSDSFRPSVTLRPEDGQGDVTIVAGRVQFDLKSTTEGDLNGVYDYDPTSKKGKTDEKSSISKAISKLGHDASILSMVEHDGDVYVAGKFSHDKAHHIVSVTGGDTKPMPGGGLNSKVSAMTVLDNTLYVGGQFNDTSDGGEDGMDHVASYSFSSKKWSALGAGLNGPVDSVYPLQLNVSTAINETTVAVSGNFDQIRAFNGHPSVSVAGFAIWVPSRKAWLQSLNVTQMEFAGYLSAVAAVNNTSILAGSLTTDGITTGGAVSLHQSKDLNLVPLSMKVDHTKSSTGLMTGAYDTESKRNLTIFGGHFTATGSDGSAIENVVILNGSDSTLSGLPRGVDANSTVVSMIVSNNTLYAGGNITGSTGDNNLGGLVAYDLSKNEFSPKQPSALYGEDVIVNSIASRPGSSEVYVGGSFDTAGQLPCVSVCFFDSNDGTWNRAGVTISGTVLTLDWASHNKLLAVGDLEISGNKSAIATYDAPSSNWKSFPGASKSEIPGTITAFAPASEDLSKFWLGGTSTNGSSFLLSYDGSKFQSAGKLFSEGTVIRGLEVLPVSDDHSKVSLLNDDQTLLIMGDLVIPDFGNASAALYNGSAVTPFILSTRSDGRSGSMSQLFSEHQNPYTNHKTAEHHHSNGIVVLVAFCCALGCVFLIVLAGVILNKIQRRRQGYTAAPQTFGTDRPSDMERVPPEYLFNSLRQPNPSAPVI
ncbi:hypothetical protein NUU61_002418 [Penicillium alfredii]|uniref:Cellular morphogenesis protein n=1 Tax=Penicillium alfredii TaxID=1506179 RepID=A0A9W9FRH4_9EURO|nr:uncharacterized protein NUU61_002418 [Penicillium alfredii]KAJ5105071.1 hypothetical protein NUU61_002418 [Penicillium alfredii]